MAVNKRQLAKDFALLSREFGERVFSVDENGNAIGRDGRDVQTGVLAFERTGELNNCCGVLEMGEFVGTTLLERNKEMFDATYRVWESTTGTYGVLLATTSQRQPQAAAFLKRHGFSGVSAHNPHSGNNITVWTKVLNKPQYQEGLTFHADHS